MQTGTLMDRVDGLLEHVGAAERVMRMVQARRLKTVHDVHLELGGELSSLSADSVSAEISCLLNISARSASRLQSDAVLICSREHLFEAFQHGDIDQNRAKIIATLLHDYDLQAQLEDSAISYATQHTPSELRRWILAHLPESGDEISQKTELDKRCVHLEHGQEGMSEIFAYVSTDLAETLFSALDRIAREHKDPDDVRTMDQRRAAALADLLDERTTVTTTVAVVLPASGTGASFNNAPLPWSAAWHLACKYGTAWTSWLAAPDGRIINTSPDERRIPERLAKTVRARDRHCRFPGCQPPAARCDLDHTVAFPEGKTTDENLHCLCRRHHRLKHKTAWTVRCIGDNKLEWTSPAGRIYVTRPPDALTPGG